MNPVPINTQNLLLIPINLDIVEALLAGAANLLSKLGLKAATGWPSMDLKEILPMYQQTLKLNASPSGFETWMIVKKDIRSVVGDIGFHSQPDKDGIVEIGFGIVASYRGRGIGFEALQALLQWSLSQSIVQAVRACCSPENNASAALLKKAGMTETSRDDELIYWGIQGRN